MKEKIYTIPISDAFATVCLCPFCTIKTKIEGEYAISILGASMMEPDIRIRTNEMGFCKDHFKMLKNQNKALPLALIIQTHLKEASDKTFTTNVKKKTLFGEKVDNKANAAQIIEKLEMHNKSCYICNKIDFTMSKFIENTIFMWDSEPEFKKIFDNTPSFCIKHFSDLLKFGIKTLNNKNFDEFYNVLCNKEKSMLDNLYQDVTDFANSFDYRNKEPMLEKAKSAVKRSIELL